MVERRVADATIGSNILGAAFVADEGGYLLTAGHVVEGLAPAELSVRTMFSPSGGYAMRPLRVDAVIPHPNHDLAVLRVHRTFTRGRAVPLASPSGVEVGDDVLLLGYALGTDLTFCDEILGNGSPKSPTPLAFRGTVSALVPHDGRPVQLYVTDATTFGGNSGGPLVSVADGAVVGVHLRGVDRRVAYALPIRIGLEFLQSVIAADAAFGAKEAPRRVSASAQTAPLDVATALVEFTKRLEEAAALLAAERDGERPDPGLIGQELADKFAVEQIDLLSYDLTPHLIAEIVHDRPLVGPEVLLEIELDSSILGDNVPRKLEERTVKAAGEVWRIHKNDADPFPSNPHAHSLDTGLKLDLSTGELYQKRTCVGSITRKALQTLRERATGVDLPPLAD